MHTRLGAAARLFVTAFLLTGCGAGDGQVSHTLGTPAPSPVLRESKPPFLLVLPQSGPAQSAPLPEKAAQLRVQALEAVRAARWGDAAKSFAEARDWAHCAPSLVFNLALAYEGKGDPMSAGLYFRAYLAMVPDAPDAQDVAARIRGIHQKLIDLAARYGDEAERVAARLDGTPPAGGRISLRAQAYQQMATFYYFIGEVSRADALLAQLRALPGMRDQPDPHTRQIAGALTNVYRRDTAATAKLAAERDFFQAWIDALNGDADAAFRSVRNGIRVSNLSLGALLTALKSARAYDAVNLIDQQRLKALTEWNGRRFKDIADDMLLMFWDGRPDLAVDLARHLQAYFRANDRGLDWDRVPYFSVLAVLYDWDGLEAEITDLLSREFAFHYFPVNEVVLILGALAPSADGPRLFNFIDRYAALSQEISEKFYERSGFGALPDAQVRLSPTWVVRDRIVDGTLYTVSFDDAHLQNVELLVKFFVAVGDASSGSTGALRLKSRAALYQLQRLADPTRAAVVAEQAQFYAEAACQGWRPRDAAHARRAWIALQIAEAYAAAPSSDTLDIDGDLQRTAREKPESLPLEIAEFAGNYRLMDALIGD